MLSTLDNGMVLWLSLQQGMANNAVCASVYLKHTSHAVDTMLQMSDTCQHAP
jgi:hypothetical protein